MRLKGRAGLLNVICILLLTSLLAAAFDFQLAWSTSPTIIVPDDYLSIQEAINYARPGDTVFVKEGIYFERIVVDKNDIMLIGENTETTIIDGGGRGIVVYVKANNTVFNGFTVQNSGWDLTDSGIYLNYSFNISVSKNNVINNNLGIYLYASSNAILRNNRMTGNLYNFGVYSWNLQGYIHKIDVSNIVDEKPITYWVNKDNDTPPDNAGYVSIVNSTNITVENLTLTKNWQGMLFAYTTNSTIRNVKATNNMDGAWLLECSSCSVCNNNASNNNLGGIAIVNSSSCFVYGNNINNNGEYGVLLSSSSDNVLYHNNFINNKRPAWLYEFSENTWDYGYPNGGNYWSDYAGSDKKNGHDQDETGSDEIGDSPYVIDSHNKDRYPLMKPWATPPSRALSINIVLCAIAGIAAIIIIFGIVVYLIKLRKPPSEVKIIQDPQAQKEWVTHEALFYKQE